ncbi:lipase 3-like [Trichogramma pretiosum]|uniref:lipase 3-like n=1 Tax=Trichogramma pretiosum TaxID=7493 RepID=UPI000C71994F|nr:lipase 3-like [Trichogramma pretiosum]
MRKFENEIILIMMSYFLQVHTFVRIKPKSEMAKGYMDYDPLENIDKDVDCYYLIEKRNYPVEKHIITSDDGYRIAIYRIPGSPKNPTEKRLPVVVQHGLLATCAEWILFGPKHDLVFMLADLGHEIWITNSRGTNFGRSHLTLSPDHDPEFWEYSYHEMAVIDMPNIVDYVLNITNEQQVMYIGHSMGTAISYIFLSTRPEYQQKVKLSVSFTPVAYWYDPQTSLIGSVKAALPGLVKVFEGSKIYEVFPSSPLLKNLVSILCNNRDSTVQNLCQFLVDVNFGKDSDQVPDLSVLAKIVRYMPGGTSRQTLKHFVQNIVEGDFRPLDFGPEKNTIKYGTPYVLPYNLKNISTPFALFYGLGDMLLAPHNIIYLSKVLPNVEVVEAVPHEKFNHLDFVLARDVKTLLYDRVMEVMARYY